MSDLHFVNEDEQDILDLLPEELYDLYYSFTEENELELCRAFDEYIAALNKITSENIDDNNEEIEEESEQEIEEIQTMDKKEFFLNYLRKMYFQLEEDREARLHAITVDVASDNLSAKIKIALFPKSQPPFTRDEIVEHIEAAGVVNGRNFQVVDKLVHKPVYNVPFEIARATMPVDGVDGTYVLYFDRYEERKVAENEDGIIDFKNINVLNNVVEGDLVAEIIPPVDGVIGTNVLGKDIPFKKPKEADIVLGENVRLDEETNKIYATCDGAVKFVKNKIFVSNVITIDAVDYSTGNIDFNGAVVVKGNVLSGFKIKTTDSIVIKGLVEEANLEAANDITIQGGINGGLNKNGNIKAGGNVRIGYAENVNITAEGNINTDSMINCNVVAFGDIESKKIIGGKVLSHQNVIADTIGNNTERFTEVTLSSINPLEEVKADYEAKLLVAKSKYEENSKNIQELFVQDIPDQQKKALTSKYFLIDKKINKDFADLRNKIREVEAQIAASENSIYLVKVKNKIYPNVVLTIDKCKYIVRDEIKYCEFKIDGADVCMTGIL